MGKNSVAVQRRADAKRRDARDRRWTFVSYPESMPDMPEAIDIITTCDSTGHAVKWIRSPLHDADLNADESEKKPHWHWLLVFQSEKSFSQVKDITDRLHAPVPQICKNPHGLVRYFIHADNPEKHQYSREDIVKSLNFGSIDKFFEGPEISAEDRANYLAEMMDYCDEHVITRMRDLYIYARREKRDSWFRVLVTSSAVSVMRVYTDGIWQEQQELEQKNGKSEMQKLREKYQEDENE